jgi:putative Holliday junction resolvase
VPFLDPAGFAAALPPSGALLGLDVGTKTLGLAVSDVTRMIATPLLTLPRSGLARDLDRLAAVVAERDIRGFVVGLPLSLDGRAGRRAQAVRQFVRDLLIRLPLPCLLWDERLSTAAVERVLIAEADLSRKKRHAVVDRSAAAFILQGALDRLARHAPPVVHGPDARR